MTLNSVFVDKSNFTYHNFLRLETQQETIFSFDVFSFKTCRSAITHSSYPNCTTLDVESSDVMYVHMTKLEKGKC